jgi:hypothetical protein
MKPFLSSDFTVSVKHQIWEESPEVADFYQGIYCVTLNFLLNVMFVPEFERNANNWPPALPENADYVSSEIEARLFTVALSDYSVTPNSLLSGQQEIITQTEAAKEIQNGDSASDVRVVFYVSPEEFAIFSKELHALAEKTPGVHDYVKISEIENLEFAKFILSSVINSPYFLAKDMKTLVREYQPREAVAQIEK